MMNKKGQAIFVGIMIFIMAIIVIVQLVPILKTQVIEVRDPTALDCTNTSISVGNKVACVVFDSVLFYYFGVAIGVAGVALSGRFLLRRN